MKIYGAGLAGLIAANMLRRHKPVVFEAQASLPHNHDALLRFRSDAVSRATGIPFRKVRVHKSICHGGTIHTEPKIFLANKYSMKVTGEISNRSIWDLAPVDRYIAPSNLISLLAEGLDIRYLEPLDEAELRMRQGSLNPGPIISTIPMNLLMRLVQWGNIPHFQYRTITNLTCDILSPKVDVYQTMYYPGLERWHRASITGNHLMIEIMGEYDFNKEDFADRAVPVTLSSFGIPKDAETTPVACKVQRYGKISPIPDNVRREFILAMSDIYGIYSLGRYGTWRQLLLDDVVHDVQIIDGFINQRDGYAKKLAGHA